LGNGLTATAALLVLLLLTGGEGVRAQPAASAPGTIAPPTEYLVAGHSLRLVVEGEVCVVEGERGTGGAVKLTLDLRPPCHLLTWREPPPRLADKASDGLPLGSAGAPMAWRYPGKAGAGVVVLAVIGDPLPEHLRASSLARLREQQGMRCGASVQGILLRGETVELSRKREHVGVLCAELGLNEKDFWLLAHP
jgi:hypothetical protein